MSNLIPLQTAYIRQSKDVRDNAWIVFDTDNNELAELPNHLSPEQAMSYLHFARKFELEALNIGIRYGRETTQTEAKNTLDILKWKVEFLEHQNISLAAHLERNIVEGA